MDSVVNEPPTWEEIKSWPKGSAAFAEKMAGQNVVGAVFWERGDLTMWNRIQLLVRGVEDFSDLSSQEQVEFLKTQKIPERYWPGILDKANDSGKIAAAG